MNRRFAVLTVQVYNKDGGRADGVHHGGLTAFQVHEIVHAYITASLPGDNIEFRIVTEKP